MCANVNKLINCIIIFVLAIFIAGCYPVQKESDLYGVYIADYKVAREVLILNEDGTFIQVVTIKSNSKVDVAMGKWKFDPMKKYDYDSQVIFDENYMSLIGPNLELLDYKHPKFRGILMCSTLKFFGIVSIIADISYKKVHLAKIRYFLGKIRPPEL